MKKMFFMCLMISVIGCGSSSSSGGAGGNACEATTSDEFFAALAGDTDFTAVDSFVENGDAATADDTFVDGQTYSVTIDDAGSVVFPTENGEVTYEFDESQNDLFEAADHEINVLMIRNGIRVLIQQPCDDSEKKLFITYTPDGLYPPVPFFWRLDS